MNRRRPCQVARVPIESSAQRSSRVRVTKERSLSQTTQSKERADRKDRAKAFGEKEKLRPVQCTANAGYDARGWGRSWVSDD